MTSRAKLMLEICRQKQCEQAKSRDSLPSIPFESRDSLPSIPTNHQEDELTANSSDGDFSNSGDEIYVQPTNITTEDSDSNEEVLAKKKCKRKKIGNPENWKVNVNKQKRSSGIPYFSKTGVKRPAKLPKPVNCSQCWLKCSDKIDDMRRKEICLSYWKLDYCRQKDFIIKCVTEVPIKRRTTKSVRHRESSREYFLCQKRVCKRFFLTTLCISHGPVDKALDGHNKETGIYQKNDGRGHHSPSNKTSKTMTDAIRKHIESFPVMESHYCRKDSCRKYLDPKLSIRKMYELFRAQTPQTSVSKFPTETTYRRYFCNNFNISFFKPKKDTCLICEKFKKTKDNEEEYLSHIKRKDEAFSAKQSDKDRSSESFVSATFDLQSVLQIPSSDVSPMYYSRKLCVYNLTVYEAALPNRAHCFAWTELNGQRGSCEIGTALLKWIRQLPTKVKEIALYSDTCSGQNRNQFIAALFLFVVQSLENLEAIQHNFLESGHSYMEVDSMHSAIETAKKYVSVYTMNDWLNVFKMARSKRGPKKKQPYEVEELKCNDMIDLKALASVIIKNRSVDNRGNKVQWLKIKCMRYEKKKPDIIFFKYNYSDENFEELDVGKSRSRRHPNVMPANLDALYQSQISISQAKKKDLLNLCKTGAIPVEYHAWYESLPSTKNKNDVAPEPGLQSESEDES